MEEEVKPSSNSNNEQILTLWKRMERLEEKMERALENLDSKVQALEMAHQLQTYQNSMTKEKLDELARGQVELLNSLKKDRTEDKDDQKKTFSSIMERLDALQFKNKAQTFDKIIWMIVGLGIAALFAIFWNSIVNVPI